MPARTLLRILTATWFACAPAAAAAPDGAPHPAIKLALPRTAQVAANRDGAVLKTDGSLWTWSEKTRNVPLRVGDGFVQLALGESHAAAIKTDGTLWAWGSNARGQLGDRPQSDVPVRIGRNFRQVAAGSAHTYGIRDDGALWAWGGKALPGKFAQDPEPTPPPVMLGTGFASVAAHDNHAAAIKADGSLWMWGVNHDGSDEQTPTLVGRDFIQVAVGYGHTAGIKNDGSLWTWGANAWGQLGDGTRDARATPAKIGDGFVQVAAGYMNTAAVKSDGTLWAWGGNENGQFGDCTTNAHPSPVKIGDAVLQVEVGDRFILASRRDGSQWTWGWHWDGDQTDTPKACRKAAQVHLGQASNRWDLDAGPPLAQHGGPPPSAGIAGIAAGASFSALVKADGSLWTWGSNAGGQLADGTMTGRSVPVLVASAVAQAGAGARSLTVLKQDGTLSRWGGLERAPASGAVTPVKVRDGVVQVLASGYQRGRGLGLRADGTLWDWPYLWDLPKPPVKVGHQVRAIAAGGFGSFALRPDGTLWRLKDYPVEAPALVGKDFVRVVSATDHAYGIKADGSLWAWGDNAYHQLGDGGVRSQDDPVNIGSGFAEVASGRFHGVALKRDGSLWAWGRNETGAVGDGSTTDRGVPVRIGRGFSKIAAGDYHSVAVKTDGTVWAWGNNEDGQLGDGSTQRRLAPVPVATDGAARLASATTQAALEPARVRAVGLGLYYACALLGNGQVRCWGSNSNGQLGYDRHAGTTPLPVKGVEQAVALVVLYDRACAALANGHALCWGNYNGGGERIEGSGAIDAGPIRGSLAAMLATELEPVRRCPIWRSGKVSGNCSAVCGKNKSAASDCAKIASRMPFLRDAVGIEGNQEVVCGVMKNGKVQCARQDTEASYVIDALDDVVALKIYSGNGCAIQRDGKLKCWGDNGYGELGNGKQGEAAGSRPIAATVIGLE